MMSRLRKRPIRGHQLSLRPAWIVLTAILLLLSAPFLSGFYRPSRGASSPERYRAPSALTGKCLPFAAAIVSIERSGVIRFSYKERISVPLSGREELFDAVAAVTASDPECPFVLKVDKETQYETVDFTLSVLRSSDVRTVYFHAELPRDLWGDLTSLLSHG